MLKRFSVMPFVAVVSFFLLVIAPSTAFAGWSCSEIKTGSEAVSIFDNFWQSSLAYHAVSLLFSFVPLCLSIWWLGHLLRAYQSRKRRHMHTWFHRVMLVLSAALIFGSAYPYLGSFVHVINRVVLEPTWVDTDIEGLLSSCSIMTYTLSQGGRIVLAIILLTTLAAVVTIIRKQVLSYRAKRL